MRGFNQVMLIGNLGAAPDLKKINETTWVCKLQLATTETFKDATGKQHSDTQWHSVVLWRSIAELAGKFLKKGSLVFIRGKLQYRNYTDEAGTKHYITEVVGEEMIMLDKQNKE